MAVDSTEMDSLVLAPTLFLFNRRFPYGLEGKLGVQAINGKGKRYRERERKECVKRTGVKMCGGIEEQNL